jgi:hypothetical protein
MVIWEIRSTKYGTVWEGREDVHRFQLRETGDRWQLTHRLEGDYRFEPIGSFEDFADARYTAGEWIKKYG